MKSFLNTIVIIELILVTFMVIIVGILAFVFDIPITQWQLFGFALISGMCFVSALLFCFSRRRAPIFSERDYRRRICQKCRCYDGNDDRCLAYESTTLDCPYMRTVLELK